jgi:hypothetical protein
LELSPATKEAAGAGHAQTLRAVPSLMADPLPWEPAVEASLTPMSVGVERRAFVGIGLLLYRAPHRAESAKFEKALRIWAKESALPTSYAFARPDPMIDKQADSGSALPIPLEGAPFSPSRTKDDDRVNLPATDLILTRKTDLLKAEEGSTSQIGAEQVPVSSLREEGPTASETADKFASGMATQLGGVLFLIPFLRALGLPRVLESEFGFQQPLSGWTLLELIACCLLGPSQQLLHDPLWRTLRFLDGRQEFDPPASDFAGCEIYRLPSSWRNAIPAQPEKGVTFRFSERRLLIRHSLGFPLVDWKASTALTARELNIELEGLGSDVFFLDRVRHRTARPKADRLREPLPKVCSSNRELGRFLHFVLPYVRWRLSDQLAQGGRLPKTSLADLLCRRGQLYVTSTHVDLVMDLRQASLPVRLAGLDANPGWVRELGRVITFHYR